MNAVAVSSRRERIYNWNTGLWENPPVRWVYRRVECIGIVLPAPTTLELGVGRGGEA